MTNEPMPRQSRRELHTSDECRACWDVLEMCIRDVRQTFEYMQRGHFPPNTPIRTLAGELSAIVRLANARNVEPPR